MMLDKCLCVLLLLCVYSQASIREVRPQLLFDLSKAGEAALQSAVSSQTDELQKAIDAHAIVDSNCDVLRQSANASCTRCVERKCTRKKNTCPTLGNIIHFIIPNFFENTIPNAAEAGGKRLVSIGSDIGNRVAIIGGDIGRRLGYVAGQTGQIAIAVGQKFKEATEKAREFAESAGKKVIDFGEDAIGALVDAANTVKNFLTGKRRRSLQLVRRAAEPTSAPLPSSPPSCNDLLANPKSCGYYANAHVCRSCSFNAETACVGWKASNDKVLEETADAKWIEDQEADNKYGIEEVKYNFRNFDFETGGFTKASVIVSLFGNRYKFTIAESLDLVAADETTAGVIVNYAIGAAKLAKAGAV